MAVLKRIYSFALEIYFRFLKHNGFLLAGGIAFFTFLSLFPLLLLIGIVLGYFLESAELRNRIIAFVFTSFPALTDVVRENIESLIRVRGSAGLIALITLLWSGTGLFGGLASALNAVYEVKETRNIVIQRLLALLVLVIVTVLLLVSFGATTLAAVLRDQFLQQFLPDQVVTFTGGLVSFVIGLASSFLLFLIIYWLTPNVRQSFRNIWFGTLLAGLAWEMLKYVLALYLQLFAREGYGIFYGTLAGIVLSLFWLNISAMLFLIGAEINVLYTERRKGGVRVFEPREAS